MHAVTLKVVTSNRESRATSFHVLLLTTKLKYREILYLKCEVFQNEREYIKKVEEEKINR
jgi:hypothetical protein